ncbi:MAG: tetratricopeptide repeat protein, partial [Kiritimatiellae bacterium]|nr:tetratricopeptide repeat protein [Kiritimatiellia bacterium]
MGNDANNSTHCQPWLRCSLGILVAVTVIGQIRAQDFERPQTTTETELVPSRKLPSVFHRPSRATAPEQLLYAESLYAAGRLRKAARAFDALVHAWPRTEEAVLAQMRLGQILEERGRYEQAFREYQYLIENYAGRFPYADILERQFQIAKRIVTQRLGKFLFFPGYRAPERALPLLETIVRNGPRWDYAAEAQFLIGTLHEESGAFEEAVVAYDRVQYRYPKSPFVVEAAFRRAMCEYQVARRNNRDESTCQAALSALGAFVRNYPDDPRVAEARALMD